MTARPRLLFRALLGISLVPSSPAHGASVLGQAGRFDGSIARRCYVSHEQQGQDSDRPDHDDQCKTAILPVSQTDFLDRYPPWPLSIQQRCRGLVIRCSSLKLDPRNPNGIPHRLWAAFPAWQMPVFMPLALPGKPVSLRHTSPNGLCRTEAILAALLYDRKAAALKTTDRLPMSALTSSAERILFISNGDGGDDGDARSHPFCRPSPHRFARPHNQSGLPRHSPKVRGSACARCSWRQARLRSDPFAHASARAP